jgi:hypothetical protein
MAISPDLRSQGALLAESVFVHFWEEKSGGPRPRDALHQPADEPSIFFYLPAAF